MLKFIFICGIAISFLESCGQNNGNDGELEIKFGEAIRYVVPKPSSDYTCEQLNIAKDLSEKFLEGPYVVFPTMTINWKNSENVLKLASIRVKFKSSILTNDYTCFFDSGGILALNPELLTKDSELVPTSFEPRLVPSSDKTISFSTNSYTTTYKSCALKCGEIPVSGLPGYLNGSVTLTGIIVKKDGSEIVETPITATTTVRFQNIAQ